MSENSKKSYSEIIIITGGCLEEAFACDFVRQKSNPYIIGVDKGIEFLYNYDFFAQEIMGDFDSVDEEILTSYLNNKKTPIKTKFKRKKDDTDTQLAIERAAEISIQNDNLDVYILGGTGSRMDHFMGNVHGLLSGFNKGVNVYIINSKNKIYICPKKFTISRQNQHGVYFSLIPLTESVKSLYLEGFKYPLSNYNLIIHRSIAISNEIVEEFGKVSYESGVLLAIESCD